MNDLQKALLEMLKWYHNFCCTNQLRYYIIGGSMLGAIRHGGFIPWDDDIDVGMPRKDYERFLQIANQECSQSHFIVESSCTGNPDFLYPFAKLYDTSTTLIERLRPPIKRGIYIDIFPLDGMGNSIKEAYRYFTPLERKINFLNTRVCVLNRKRKLYKNLAIILSRMLPNFFLNNHVLVAQIEKMCAEHDFDQCAIVGCLVGAWGRREIVPRAYFGMPTAYQFEGITVFGVEDYDRYLTSLYGNYMKPPEEENRHSHHNYSLCSLKESFLENRD